jgi:exonuclease III
MNSISADVFCISETWASHSDDFARYTYKDYLVFGNCRPTKLGGGVMTLVNPMLRPVQCICHMPKSNVYNICAVKLLATKPCITIIAVYLPPNTRCADTTEMFCVLKSIVGQSSNFIVVGDFNIPIDWTMIDWSAPVLPTSCTAETELTEFILGFDLRQLNTAPTRLTNTLDLVLVPPRFHDCS